MLVAIAASDLASMNRTVDASTFHTEMIVFINEGVRQCHYGRSDAAGLNRGAGLRPTTTRAL